MKKKVLRSASIILLGTGIVGLSWATANYNHVLASPIGIEKTKVDSSNPKTVAKKYFDAFLANDIENMINYSKDVNYLDEKSRREGYEEFKPSHLESYEIVSYQEARNDKIDILVQYKYSDMDFYPKLPYSIIKDELGWKVLIKPLIVNLNKNSPEYGNVKEGIPMYKIKLEGK
ncbi:hypothetical protein J2Z22_000995 [Paenibacillus forsythiae]|uniref:DUF4878 domain-containing protein n=1 Tax=Paenibacillus forsythiae TaxID=365616 RepID=A0ABU3H3T3_9BACL|nr:hypothetical protein [Paenibacillus forsythiae]MDT3425479.1 hypothetical protein [Paenibacillus forsythiae]